MGFRLNRTYVLQFDGPMTGAEVKLRSTSCETTMAIREGGTAKELAELLADHVIDWNLEDAKGVKLPFTAKALLSELEESVLALIVREWYKAAVGVTAPLVEPSTSGEQSPVESIPMETL